MASLWLDRWNVWESPRTHHGPWACPDGAAIFPGQDSYNCVGSRSVSIDLYHHSLMGQWACALTHARCPMWTGPRSHASGLLGGCSRDGGKVRLIPTGKGLEITLIGGSSGKLMMRSHACTLVCTPVCSWVGARILVQRYLLVLWQVMYTCITNPTSMLFWTLSSSWC
jgi:hypothetical protein